ncbi:MAG: hypothetical protein M1546_25535 [Chloroflexi bacterium]|nr:hypothetical protein [Chloroflexota bacterium]
MTFTHKIAIVGNPTVPDLRYDDAQLANLKRLGFNTIQLNIAWGARPADEPLNLEDVIQLPGEAELPRVTERRNEIQRRAAACKRHGFRTLFHFGAPYVPKLYQVIGDPSFKQALKACIQLPETVQRYHQLLTTFAAAFPAVDDILVYTYDQDAWQCSEFGDCPRCKGMPLHERLPAFLTMLRDTWAQHRPNGTLWWEPWELSAGQIYTMVEQLPAHNFGLMLHANIAEAQVTHTADPWFRTTSQLAQARGIPVTGELFMSSCSEEIEPLQHVLYPRLIYRQLTTLHAVDGVSGVKEYYGLLPDRNDPNLEMAGMLLNNPDISLSQALAHLSTPYAPAREDILAAWEQAATGFELLPWNISWLGREMGYLNPCHGWDAAFVRGTVADSPSWQSTRRAIFMTTEDLMEPHPWLLEDIGLRYELASTRFEQALAHYRRAAGKLSGSLQEDVRDWTADLGKLQRSARTYQYHIQETLVAKHIRAALAAGGSTSTPLIGKLQQLLQADVDNQGDVMPLSPSIATAREMLIDFQRDPETWVQTHLLPPKGLRTPGNPFHLGLTTA